MKWTIEESNTPGLYDVYDEGGDRVVRHTTSDRAALIAAAPDMLATLETIATAWGEWQALFAAIAKARGEEDA